MIKEVLKRIYKYIFSNSNSEVYLDGDDSNEPELEVNDSNIINLDEQYKWLDKVFHCSIGKSIELAINEDMTGSYEYSYVLKNYKIDGIYNSIKLELERKNDIYIKRFSDIEDIKWSGKKVWIYSKNNNYRFYHNVDGDEINLLGKNFKTKSIELKEDIEVYMKYKNVNMLLYYVEKQKYEHRNYENKITQESMIDKIGNKILLLNIQENECDNKAVNTIYAYSESGQEGVFHYQLKDKELYIVDMLPRKHSMGIGSNVLRFMESIAKENNINKLTGMLSHVDFDHKERLLYFYKKNGFKVNKSESWVVKEIS